MQIDPKATFWFGVLTSILLGVATGAVHLPTTVSAAVATEITSWSAFLGWINTVILTALSGYSSNRQGPLVAAPSLPTSVKALIAFMVLVGGLAFMPQAHAAQVTLPGAKSTATAAATVDPIQALMAKLTSANADIVKNTIEALTAADSDAGTVINTATGDVKDPISHACYPAQIKFLNSLPAAASITVPAPYNLIVLFQIKRDFVAQLKAGIPPYLTVGCSALLGDEVTTFIKTLALVGIVVAAPAVAPLLPSASLLPVLPSIAVP